MNDPAGYGMLQQPTGGYGSSQSSTSPYRGSPPRIAQAPKKKPSPNKEPRTRKAQWKAVKDGPRQATRNIYFLLYFSDISRTFTFDTFLQNLHGSTDPTQWGLTSDFEQAQVNLVRLSNSDTAWTDLGNALHETGAIVVYWGHSERAKNSRKARNLRPRPDSDDASRDIAITQLKALVKTMNAKAFIVAACASNGCIGKVDRDTALIATDSGKDLLTNSLDWANALLMFLKKFIASGTINECIAEANASFAQSSDPDDRFVLASGVGAMTLTS